jgi:hypothetical protein
MDNARWPAPLLILACFACLFLACYRGVLDGKGQFGYRDAGHYYYPLYQRVQAEWSQGRWPLWEMEENAGMPLLGNPTAAVLYPGKLIYGLLPYPWAARVYILAHSALAFLAMLVLMRGWAVGWAGSGMAALCYAFGMPVLFQYSNVVYLVGAAWLPLGFLAVDRWLRDRHRAAVPGLALVLAMQFLGGDPQSAYLLGFCAVAYAVGLAQAGGSTEDPLDVDPGARTARAAVGRWRPLLVGAGVIVWFTATVVLAVLLPALRPQGGPGRALPWMPLLRGLVLLGWIAALLVLCGPWRGRGRRSRLREMLAGLVAAALLAIALGAAQLLPVIEFMQQTLRARGEGLHDLYSFSIEPVRLAEMAWPGVLGSNFGRNTRWIDAVWRPGTRLSLWTPSLYLGGWSVVLAAGGFRLRSGPRWRVWLSIMLVISLLGSLGQNTSPIWITRCIGEALGLRLPGLGPLESGPVTPVRADGFLRDGDGGLYWLLATLLPGFLQFRYPAKLYTLTAFSLAALAGVGWDSLQGPEGQRPRALAAMLLAVSLGLIAVVSLGRGPILAAIGSRAVASSFGPLDGTAGWRDLLRGLVQGAAILALALAVFRMAPGKPGPAGLIGLLVVTADLAIANARFVTAVPQELFESPPEVARIIAEAERKDPFPGPFRVHRMPLWNPAIWSSTSSPDRVAEFVAWERGTIEPKYGINVGIEYTQTAGVAELEQYESFFRGFACPVDAETARAIGDPGLRQVFYYPRRGFDLWNTRYFVLPANPNGWLDPFRAYASFLPGTEQVEPPPATFQGADRFKAWVETRDYQVRRNLQAHRRAWVVHSARGLRVEDSVPRAGTHASILDVLYGADPIWREPGFTAYDARRQVWLRNDQRSALREFLKGDPPSAAETVTVDYLSPQCVVLEATLETPGIVVLADIAYPGWRLTIDGQEAPIHSANGFMRGAAVLAGRHRLVYTYLPRAFKIGLAISLGTLASMAFLALGACACRFSRRSGSDGNRYIAFVSDRIVR